MATRIPKVTTGGERLGQRSQPQAAASRCVRKFLRIFPMGFRDAKYLDWERNYKWTAHQRWTAELGRAT